MATVIPDTLQTLFNKRAFAHLATLMPDGRPQSTPVWCEFDGRHVLINSAAGRRKDKNIVRDGRVALSLTDPENPYNYIEVRGRVVERTEKGAVDHINHLSMKYLGKPYPFTQPGEQRVLYRIEPEHVTSMG
jgi:PPOX class probable F420-dependent enzyme